MLVVVGLAVDTVHYRAPVAQDSCGYLNKVILPVLRRTIGSVVRCSLTEPFIKTTKVRPKPCLKSDFFCACSEMWCGEFAGSTYILHFLELFAKQLANGSLNNVSPKKKAVCPVVNVGREPMQPHKGTLRRNDMALAIPTSSAALQASASASTASAEMEAAMTRISTGKRINSSADDAAGTAIVSRLTAEIATTEQSIRNALDGQALIDTSEGAHKEIENILQRMREIAVQSANDTNNTQDRANLSEEMRNLSEEVDRIATVTTWAGSNLLAETASFSFEVGSATGDANTISFDIKSMKASELNIQPVDIGVDTMENSLAAIDNLDAAIAAVNTQRSNLGATSNRLSYTISNLTNISTNLETAKGTIEDADYALETTNLARAQILKQASTAMLAQANADQESVLSLLRG